jgi:hypothetical protein
VWSYVLLSRSPSWLEWLRVAVLLAGLAAAAILLAGPWFLRAVPKGRGRFRLAAAPVTLALVAGLSGPLAYSLDTAATAHTGALPSAGPTVASSFGGPSGFGPGSGGAGGSGGSGFPGGPGGTTGSGTAGGLPSGRSGSQPSGGRGFPSGRSGALPSGRAGGPRGIGGPGGIGGGLGGNTQVSAALTRLLRDGAPGFRWAAATVSSDSAAPLQLAGGKPVMSIGGFNGTDPAPTLAQFEKYVADHEIHYFVGANSHSFGGGSGDAAKITAWVEAHFRSETIGGETVYNLTSPKATS